MNEAELRLQTQKCLKLIQYGCLQGAREATVGDGRFRTRKNEIWKGSLSCTGAEKSIKNCLKIDKLNDSCENNLIAAVVCDVSVKLISAENNTKGGRVEVYYQGVWGTVCNKGWDIKDANVICKQLGFVNGSLAEYDSTAQQGSGTVWLKDLNCTGNENSLTFCSRGSWNMTSGCSHKQDVSLICLPKNGEPHFDRINLGSNYRKECKLPGDKFVEWRDQFNKVIKGKRGPRMSADGDTLSIDKIQLKDANVYQCHGRKYSAYYVIYINFRTGDTKKYQEISEGKRGEIECKAKGSPPPTFKWSRDGKELAGSRTSEGSSLKIREVKKSDTGRYTCEILQKFHGNITHNEIADIQVNVTYLPRFVEVPPQNIVTQEGKNVRLKCNATGDPAPRIQWLLNGRPVPGGVGETLQRSDVKKSAEYEGLYTCRAYNKEGNITTNGTTLVVQVPPTVIALRNASAIIGMSFNLTCNATGFPQPHVYWRTKKRANNTEPGPLGYKILHISNMTFNQTGWYECIAENELGKDSLSVWIEAAVVPKLLITPNDTVVNKGESVTLKCTATGHPKPVITWTFNGKPVSPIHDQTNEQLTLTDVQNSKSYEGIYTCHAKNLAGEIRGYASLTVDVPPEIASSITVNISRRVGSQWREDCTATGDPTPEIHWIKEGLGTIPQKHLTNRNSTMYIESLSPNDFGNYTCIARNRAGEESFLVTVEEISSEETPPSKGGTVQWYMIVGPLVGLLILVTITANAARVCRRKTKATIEDPALSQRIADPMEFPRDQLFLDKFLGEGAFGMVWRADAQGINNQPGLSVVAVKQAKDNDATCRESLAQEIRLGNILAAESHPNVIAFYGCITLTDPVSVITEFACYGDLLGFLRASRGEHDEQYTRDKEPERTLTSYELLQFCLEVAAGMEYLHDKGIIHRDLAARNVLVGEDYVCKVTDFGLSVSRGVYGYAAQACKGRLPIKWSAPELLYDTGNDVTSKLDVWSFGILMFEILTVGGTPYPSWSHVDVLCALQKGYRIARPTHVKIPTYNVMTSCWHQFPVDRPSFGQLQSRLIDIRKVTEYAPTDILDMEMYQSHLYPANADICELTKVRVFHKAKDRPPLPPRPGTEEVMLMPSGESDDNLSATLNDWGSTFSLASINSEVDEHNAFTMTGEDFNVLAKQQDSTTEHLMPPSESRHNGRPHRLTPASREIKEQDANNVFQSVPNYQIDSSLLGTSLEKRIEGPESQLKLVSVKESYTPPSPAQQEEQSSRTLPPLEVTEDGSRAAVISGGATDPLLLSHEAWGITFLDKSTDTSAEAKDLLELSSSYGNKPEKSDDLHGSFGKFNADTQDSIPDWVYRARSGLAVDSDVRDTAPTEDFSDTLELLVLPSQPDDLLCLSAKSENGGASQPVSENKSLSSLSLL